MRFVNKSKCAALLLAAVMLMGVFAPVVVAADASSLVYQSEHGILRYLGSFDTGEFNAGGGVAEVVAFNARNQSMYVVSGHILGLDIVYLGGINANGRNRIFYTDTALVRRIDVGAIGAAQGFSAGDVTSVAVHPVLPVIAVAVQNEVFYQDGTILFLSDDGGYVAHFSSGVQPDMIGISPCGRFVMTPNEGEPINGWMVTDHFVPDGPVIDPAGSVTLVDLTGISTVAQLQSLSDDSVVTVGFGAWDNRISELIANGVLLRVDSLPSLDLEPEYIAFAADGERAFVTLQEANAIATFHIPTRTFTDIQGLGFVDHSQVSIALDNRADGRTTTRTWENIFGIRMPDGLAAIEINGVQYVLTPNEGDARGFPEEGPNGNPNHNYSRVGSGSRNWTHHSRNWSPEWVEYLEDNAPDLEFIQNDFHYVLRDRPQDMFILGGRSFSIFNADNNMSLVFDSGAEFEEITYRMFPTIFNADRGSNAGRNHRKGSEPEDIQVLTMGDRHFAFIGLERMGGVIMYEISNPYAPVYIDYLNVRCIENSGLESKEAGSHLGAEVMTVVPAENSPIGAPLILVANETSGTVTIISIDTVALGITDTIYIVESNTLRLSVGSTTYTLNGVARTSIAASYVDETSNRTMIPLSILESLGAEVGFDETTHMVYIASDGGVVRLLVDAPLPGDMGTSAIIGGNVFVPLRYVAEALGATVRWDENARTVYIYH